MGNIWFPNKPPVQEDANDFSYKKWFQEMYRFAYGESRTVPVKTSSFNADEDFLYFCNATSGTITITLPSVANYAFKKYAIKKIDSSANTVVINTIGSDTIDGASSITITPQYGWIILFSDGQSTWHRISSSDAITIGGTGGGGYLIGVEYTTGSGNWTVPANVSAVWVTMIAGGGGGSSSTAAGSNGAGGGAGELLEGEPLKVTSGGTVAYAIGSGGATDADGVDSTFGTLTCLGGKKGTIPATSLGGAGGGARGGAGGTIGATGGNGLAETSNYTGGSGGGGAGSGTGGAGGLGGGSGGYQTGGAGGATASSQGGGGGGAASIYGKGGAGGNGGVAGTAATSTCYGSGGGGAGGKTGGLAGGAGAGGYLLITYVG